MRRGWSRVPRTLAPNGDATKTAIDRTATQNTTKVAQ